MGNPNASSACLAQWSSQGQLSVPGKLSHVVAVDLPEEREYRQFMCSCAGQRPMPLKISTLQKFVEQLLGASNGTDFSSVGPGPRCTS